MDDNIKTWLLEGPPWLRYAAEKQLLGREGDLKAVLAEENIRAVIERLKYGDRGFPALLAGRLGYESSGAAFWDLLFLSDIGLSLKDCGLEEEAEALFTVWPDGCFISQEGMTANTFCITALVISSLARMGYRDDPRVRSYAARVMAAQRLDGGWHCAKSRAVGKRLEMSESCPMDNQNVLPLLSLYDEYRLNGGMDGALDLLLQHWQRRAEPWRPYGYGMGTQFRKLRYPAEKYGILRVLDSLSLYPHATRSDAFQNMLEDVTKRSIDGRYFAESVAKAFGAFDFGQTKEPSRFITFLVERIKKRAGELGK